MRSIKSLASVGGMVTAVVAVGMAVGAAKVAPSARAASDDLFGKLQWSEIAVREIELGTAPAAHASIAGEAVTTQLSVQAAATSDGLYFRLRWEDARPDTDIRDIDQFADAVAIQFAVDGDTDTPILMGDEDKPVYVWYWNAARQRAEKLFAYGFGTLARMDGQDIEAASVYENGEWTVVFHAPLTTGEIDVTVPDGIPVAFAVWDGANEERDGFKAVSLDWESFKF